MNYLRIFLLAVATMVAVSAVRAQTSPPPFATPAPPVTYSLGFGPALSTIPPTPHAPFSAVVVNQSEQTLNDGTRITRENQEVVMRDGMGRIYRGREIKRPGSTERDPRVMVTITDPVQHVQYVCTPMRVCRKMAYREPRNRQRVLGRGSNFVTVEDLGSSNINGVEVEGKRISRVIPEGTIGNDRAFTATEELWHSNELDVDVQVKRADPRTGTHTTTLTEIRPGEPDPKYFQIPEGYRVEERQTPLGVLSPLPTESEKSFPAGTIPPGSAPPNQ